MGLMLSGCGVPNAQLMVTPVIYDGDTLDPFAHVDETHRTPSMTVFFATNRARATGRFDAPMAYGNSLTNTLQLGSARVRFGRDMDWETLHEESRSLKRSNPIGLSLTDVWEHASIDLRSGEFVPRVTDGSTEFFDAINAQLRHAKDPELLIYVHGAKVNFYNACVYAAELDHFAGRDMVSLAYAWPTHQDIFAYLDGEDIARGRASVVPLATLLRLLAEHTTAQKINIICWSAGGRVVSRALNELGKQVSERGMDPAELRLGAVVFAAPDVPVHDFFERLPNIHLVAERVIVTTTDDDIALEKATQFMGGGARAGNLRIDAFGTQFADLGALSRVEVVDVSYGQNDRGFDIGGHDYWFRHAWVASDVILSLRTRLPANQRGLAPTNLPNVWYLPNDYPDRARAAVRNALNGTW